MRPRISYANVTATVALFLAIGGTSYAITVSGDDVVNGSLTGKDVHKNSLRAADVKGLPAKVTFRPGNTAHGTQSAISNAFCEQGETMVSGGYTSEGTTAATPFSTAVDGPLLDGSRDTWVAYLVADTPTQGKQLSVTAYALCAG